MTAYCEYGVHRKRICKTYRNGGFQRGDVEKPLHPAEGGGFRSDSGGRHATCYKSVADELKEAGALYEDREVVVDGNLVMSRQAADLPPFMRETMKQLGH